MPRRPFDMYETPPHYVRALMRHIDVKAASRVYEPCVGDGAIRKFMDRPDLIWQTNDIDPARQAGTHMDAANENAWDNVFATWTITNPPFNQEEDILWHALTTYHAYNWPGGGVAFLARLSFLEPTITRGELYATFGAPTRVVVLPRYSFRANDAGKRQTDSVTCAWLIWDTTDVRGVYIEGERE